MASAPCARHVDAAPDLIDMPFNPQQVIDLKIYVRYRT